MSSFSVICSAPVLAATFSRPQRMLSWSLTRPGFVVSSSVAWLQVRDADLPVDVDAGDLLRQRLAAAGYADGVQLMTSRDVRKHHLAPAESGSVRGACLATVGLANCGRVGERPRWGTSAGTINLLAHVDQALSEAAMIEALSIATEARTAAIMDLGWREGGVVVTGTGTDCIVVACPSEGPAENFAGLHTDIGAVIGRSVYDAVKRGGEEWITERRTAP